MKDRLIGFIKTYCLFVCIFVLQKPLFMLFYKIAVPRCLVCGLVQCHLAWVTFRPISGWLSDSYSRFSFHSLYGHFLNPFIPSGGRHFLFISVLISIIFTVDLGLYEYWGFRLDATPLFYFFSSPKDAVASVSIWMVLGELWQWLFMLSCCMLFLRHLAAEEPVAADEPALSSPEGVRYIVADDGGLLFILIRGGFTVSTMNVGKVYFSAENSV